MMRLFHFDGMKSGMRQCTPKEGSISHTNPSLPPYITILGYMVFIRVLLPKIYLGGVNSSRASRHGKHQKLIRGNKLATNLTTDL